jgi:hypothetical protein
VPQLLPLQDSWVYIFFVGKPTAPSLRAEHSRFGAGCITVLDGICEPMVGEGLKGCEKAGKAHKPGK